MTSSISKSLITAYNEAMYEVKSNPPIVFNISDNKIELEQLLLEHNAKSAILLTAHNPRSLLKTKMENDALHAKLLQWVNDQKLKFILAQSFDKKLMWPAETGIFIFDLPLESAKSLGKQFEQNALVVIEGDCSRLVWLA